MSKLARSDEPKVNQVQMKSQVQMTKVNPGFDILGFDIPLKFACLPDRQGFRHLGL
jgi:hypothetical protein